MNRRVESQQTTGYERAQTKWQDDYRRDIGDGPAVNNRSGVPIKPLYGPETDTDAAHLEKLGLPGQLPYTRGIYPTMHRGQTWSQRQLIGHGTPAEYNELSLIHI